MSPQKSKVLVTGATGYIAGWCIIYLLEADYQVRGTVRELSTADALKQSLKPYTSRAEELELVETDLLSDEGWDDAVAGCEYVLHIASPFPLEIPEDEEILIRPAVDGTKRVLAASAQSGVRRVVHTSSIAAVSSGQPVKDRTFSEVDWPKLNGNLDPYPKSKTLAERAAWKFMEDLPPDHPMELVVINPGYVLGPILSDREITSMALHRTLMSSSLPGITRMKFNLVDVRDIAKAHLAALTTPEAAGQRFICVAGGMFLPEVAKILSKRFKPLGYRIPSIVFPSFFVRFYGLFNQLVRENTKSLGDDPVFDSSRAKQVLHWRTYPLEKTIVDMGESLIEHGVV